MQPTLHAIFRRLSELTGQSQSQLVFELLDGSQGALQHVISLLEKANHAKEELSGSVGADLQDAQDRIERQLGLALESFGEPQWSQESFATERVPFRSRPKVAGAGEHRTRKRSAEVLKPPSSNRGVRSLTIGKKTTTSGAKK